MPHYPACLSNRRFRMRNVVLRPNSQRVPKHTIDPVTLCINVCINDEIRIYPTLSRLAGHENPLHLFNFMMDPVSFACTLLPVLDKVVKAVWLYQSWKLIPSDLDRAEDQLQSLLSDIEFLEILHSEIPESQRRVVFDPTQLRASILGLSPRAFTKPSRRNRLRWLTQDRKAFDRCLSYVAKDISRLEQRLLVQWSDSFPISTQATDFCVQVCNPDRCESARAPTLDCKCGATRCARHRGSTRAALQS
jgi:hypothetical protein